MSIKDIKIGEMYNVRVRVVKNDFGDTGEIATVTVDENGKEIDGEIAYYTEADAASFSPITPENGTKNTEPAPKYDPCRLFKKGDKVRVVTYKGRNKTGVQAGEIGLIYKDEKDADVTVEVIFYGDDLWEVDPAYLELVTPVEELEPYKCGEGIDAQLIFVNDELFAEFENEMDAKRVCALLNAEHRKENKQ